MKYTFTAWGHPNITGTHKNTIEFTKDREIEKEADCIIGVKADFEKVLLKNFLQECRVASRPQIKMDLKAGEQKEFLYFAPNPVFDDEKELVLRISNFCSKSGENCEKNSNFAVFTVFSVRFSNEIFLANSNESESDFLLISMSNETFGAITQPCSPTERREIAH